MALIRNGAVDLDDSWIRVADDGQIPERGDVIVDLARLRGEAERLAARPGRLGVRLGVEDTEEDVVPFLGRLDLIAVEFPRFVDGRGYTTARLLRSRHAFRGELRAVGNVLRDQLYYMYRCGFDAFELESGKDSTAALSAFTEVTVKYQAAADEDLPLYRRR